ncbi:unnamed protein product [Leptidea sinapis]|uniref:Kazal-like domain-containing protein n=1 Tax=Leptidea sinapis TaxID=189913 RepID=A0A5E4Q0D1_9NEOP|nr:unnamed protein product [Leptidea sinapis]
MIVLSSKLLLALFFINFCYRCDSYQYSQLIYKRNPAPDGHRCGICPTYFEKICAFNFGSNSTYIFDNHCVMDLFNCLHGTEYIPLNYENCLHFGNFGYVYGIKREDLDYEEREYAIINSKKNPDFADFKF